jgi:hypothetical protein
VGLVSFRGGDSVAFFYVSIRRHPVEPTEVIAEAYLGWFGTNGRGEVKLGHVVLEEPLRGSPREILARSLRALADDVEAGSRS